MHLFGGQGRKRESTQGISDEDQVEKKSYAGTMKITGDLMGVYGISQPSHVPLKCS